MSVKISDKKRKAVFERTQGRCGYCGVAIESHALTIDHIFPKSRGGRNDVENLMLACRPCNGGKGTKSLEEYRLWLGFHRSHTAMTEVRFSQPQVEALVLAGLVDLNALMDLASFYIDKLEEGA